MEPTTSPDQVGAAIQTGVNAAKEVISDNMLLVFSVPVAFVAWSIGKRVLGKI